ncbi:MAG: hypothetical protein KME17_26935 [Cyanosarcina radialis HA8281-LM2]|jgi:hypothetical protein|nr:hypothetical protein [Cyanosarcina radialis HA8281-LM2]
MLLEVIQIFWNSPGFIGIGVTQVRGETYLYLNPESIDWQKKTLLQLDLQNDIQNFVEFYPHMKSCQLEIMGYTVNILKLDDDVIISVLAEINTNNLPPIEELKPILDRLDEAINLLIYFSQNNVRIPTFLKKRTADKSTVTLARTNSLNDKSATLFIDRKIPEIVQIKEIVDILARLIKFSSQYIGKKFAVNYLQATRPQFEWLQKFVIADSDEIKFVGAINEEVTSTQLIWLREWVAAFSKKCSQIFPYLPVMLQKQCLTERERKILDLSLK